MNYQKENEELFTFFLENSFFKAWGIEEYDKSNEHLGNYRHLELMVNHKCLLSCKYCYMDRHWKEYFPKGSQNSNAILKNTDILFEWLYENNYKPEIELFAGDSLTDPTCRKIAHKVFDTALAGKRVARSLVVPTNMGWLHNHKQHEDVMELLEKADYSGVPMYISASVDGKYMEENRPYKSANKGYTDEFYDRLFRFLSSHPASGIHPMIYSNKIEKWIDNFLWWQDKYEEYNINWKHIYLLEVRNAEWTKQQVKDYAKFVKFLVRWSYDKVGRDPERLVDFILAGRGYNILNNPFARVGRGMPCSIQSCFCVRPGDLAVVPCHRTAYKHMVTANFRVEDNKITGFDMKNMEMWLAIQALSNETYPYCEDCDINLLCKGGCLGAQYEATGNWLTPIPTVCRLFHEKVIALIEVLKELGAYDTLKVMMSQGRINALDKLERKLEDKRWD